MTVRDALQAGVRFIRLPESSAYVELPLLPGGVVGPWATVREVGGESCVFGHVFVAHLVQDDCDRYKPYQPIAVGTIEPAADTFERTEGSARWENDIARWTDDGDV